ncbi:hypothetical protein AB4Z01_12465 [Inquilinus sp. YAF38]|uniref:hypothetical protein n=1 Tax=Inquilinus sp. YAF38 TaxID=3233084 RepID=UPI003F8E0273
MHLRLLTPLALFALAACAAEPYQPALPPTVLQSGAVQGEAAFDQSRGEALLAQAKAAEARNPGEAKSLYRQAGMAWPDLADAWDGLKRVSAEQNDAAEAKAAGFMAERVKLYPGTAIASQREVNVALQSYIQEQAKQPTDGPEQLAYAKRLGEYYDAQYARAGFYTREKDFGNIEGHDIPAVVIAGGGILGYGVTMATKLE